ncbi:hypothetical protein ACROYT_G041449 [Oculina patagonica]
MKKVFCHRAVIHYKFQGRVTENERKGSFVLVADYFGDPYRAGCCHQEYGVLLQEWAVEVLSKVYSLFRR